MRRALLPLVALAWPMAAAPAAIAALLLLAAGGAAFVMTRTSMP